VVSSFGDRSSWDVGKASHLFAYFMLSRLDVHFYGDPFPVDADRALVLPNHISDSDGLVLALVAAFA